MKKRHRYDYPLAYEKERIRQCELLEERLKECKRTMKRLNKKKK